ncbi:uncharacterized protein LOC106178028 [Lingula anatina]|uniref:Uncharacterized protein LOC106178028 n=1 Tax=Lingula anatina TaxID=7574 RepID=A0A1S3K1G7_LINAN|nr:uncharacterized protein LOC106178028 [Lingula anatina]|eukprot:XP_013416478.1 uncharacterized protein LOC106178028 [Lingula anatina]
MVKYIDRRYNKLLDRVKSMQELYDILPVIMQKGQEDARSMASNRKRLETEAMRSFWQNMKKSSGSTQTPRQLVLLRNQPPNKKQEVLPEREDRNLSTPKYFTSINTRPKGKTKSPPIAALTSELITLPPLIENGEAATGPRKSNSHRSLEDWKREVLKPVDARPAYSIPAPEFKINIEQNNELRNEKDINFKTGPMFYNPKFYPKATYVVNPEWFSEQSNVRKKRGGGGGTLGWG